MTVRLGWSRVQLLGPCSLAEVSETQGMPSGSLLWDAYSSFSMPTP